MKENRRVLIVGWDGATFDLIKPWVEQGLLPNLALLMQQGSHRPLRSVIPTLSPPAWTSFFTGKNPGRHGTFDFFRRNAANYELITDWNDLPTLGTLFHWLSRFEKHVGVMNVPFTYPPEPVNGFMISGLGAAPEWAFTYPPELKETILAQGYRIDNPVIYEEGQDEAYWQSAFETTKRRAQVALELMRTEPWDFFMTVFMNIDQVLSFMWHHMDAQHPRYDAAVSPQYSQVVQELHQYLDAILGEMRAIAGPDATVIVASDHGMGPLYKEVFLNNWLEQKGYLVRKRPSPLRNTYQTLARRLGFSRQNIWRHIGRARTQWAKQLLPQRLHTLVPNEHKALTDTIDWSQTRAYSFGNVGQIYINLRGREPEGIVAPGDEYEATVGSIMRDLETFVDPEDGKAVVDQIYRREQLYDGPFFDEAPDLNVVMRDYAYITQAQREFAERAILRPSENMSGFHRRDGIFVIAGPRIAAVSLPPASITQVAPTVLYDFGLPFPDDMDGAPMLDLFDPEYVAEHDVESVAADLAQRPKQRALTQEQEAELQRRLRDLGYMQ